MQGPSTFKVYVQPTNSANLRAKDQRKKAVAVFAVVALGEGQEKDLAHDMTTAFSTFEKSKNETVQEQINSFDPKAEELKVAGYEDEVKGLFDEVGLEGKMLMKWTKPDKK